MKEILAESYENDDELKRAIKRRKMNYLLDI